MTSWSWNCFLGTLLSCYETDPLSAQRQIAVIGLRRQRLVKNIFGVVLTLIVVGLRRGDRQVICAAMTAL
jgi:hypothetical protein